MSGLVEVAAVSGVVVILVGMCAMPCGKGRTKKPEGRDEMTRNLIPPVFYTEGMRDPLKQEDLREHVVMKKEDDGVK